MVPKGIELSHSLFDSFGISSFDMVPKVKLRYGREKIGFGTSPIDIVPKEGHDSS